MRSVLLCLLVVVPTAIALQCWANGHIQPTPTSAIRSVVQKQDCFDGEEYCLKTVSMDDHNNTHTNKSCGKSDMCTKEECTADPTLGHDEICCCKGNYCNGASGYSLLLTTSVAAAAVWLRL